MSEFVQGRRWRPFPNMNCQYGAPMGRVSGSIDPDTPPDRLCVAGPAGEYDCGGAYWGTSREEGPVWAVWVRGRGRGGVSYVRAKGRAGARLAALS